MQCHKFYWIVPGRFGVGCIREERNFKVRHGTANAGMERILVSRKANKKSSSMPRFPHGEQVPLFCDWNYYISFSSASNFCFIPKQRIDSGFFLFEAEQRKKREKKKQKKTLKNLQDFMDSSDDDFM